MPPRSNNGKKRRPQNNHRESSRYRGTAGTSQRHHDSTVFFDDDDSERKIRLLGISLPNPLPNIRSMLPSPPAPPSNVTLPAKVVLVGGFAVLLLAPLFDSYLGGGSLSSFFPPLHLLLLRRAGGGGGGGGGSSAGGENNNDENGIVGAALPHVTNDGKFHGRYPNSLLTLFYPFTLFRDVVLDQPVDPSDVPFFWHAHVSDEVAVKAVLSRCYDAEVVELNSVEDVERARGMNLVSSLVDRGRLGPAAVEADGLYNGQRRRPLVIASPHIREAAELFSQDNFGRVFSFYRHPIDYDVHPSLRKTLPPEAGANNFMTRLLSDVRAGPLSFKELGTAKQVIRQTTIAGTRDLLAESMFRFGKYYGWVPVGGSGTREGVESDDAIARACIEDAVRDAPGERYADHDSPEWHAFYEANKLDCELYEIARSTWRAQIQTIIPLTLQKRRAGEGDEDEK
ncbi:hypothetical protein ACHAW5_010105 [Stephanodiscus triporus]|uniref:Sulfotransferase domain-containing protein n=1 Tax=Stephanodiscus triporus TaxID=2934178 RepID=A0ABD3P805_9STRA